MSHIFRSQIEVSLFGQNLLFLESLFMCEGSYGVGCCQRTCCSVVVFVWLLAVFLVPLMRRSCRLFRQMSLLGLGSGSTFGLRLIQLWYLISFVLPILFHGGSVLLGIIVCTVSHKCNLNLLIFLEREIRWQMRLLMLVCHRQAWCGGMRLLLFFWIFVDETHLVGDIIALTNVRPKCIDDLNRPPRFYLIAYVGKANDIDEFPDDLRILPFKILSSKPINYGEPDMHKSKRETLFAVYLLNLTTNLRVWKALNSEEENTNIISKVLQPKSDVYIYMEAHLKISLDN
ncbi:hypothetical protein RchiOBHm_Chr3g0488001 [Rosa chinensis]|uniref:DUF6469 domain-containing protein n=1 Tax=Rosa chinensis TaxID=74649 RepID=A0A2P6RFM6_ROSCH|nr:hypothetical protein RchiOBHm_Chr3g0488001 [Rosa chinensis]